MLRRFLNTFSETYSGLGFKGRLLVGWQTFEIICLVVFGTSERQYQGIISH
jgi:hypothetical protein